MADPIAEALVEEIVSQLKPSPAGLAFADGWKSVLARRFAAELHGSRTAMSTIKAAVAAVLVGLRDEEEHNSAQLLEEFMFEVSELWRAAPIDAKRTLLARERVIVERFGLAHRRHGLALSQRAS